MYTILPNEVVGTIQSIANVTTGGNFGLLFPVNSALETELTTTSATNIVTFTPTENGMFIILVYFRVVTATTTVTVAITYDDATGAQTITPVNGIGEAVGSYNLVPLVIAATTAAAITVTMTAGTANQVYASAAIVGL